MEVLGSSTDLPKCLQVCFYYAPEGIDTNDLTEVTRYISRELHHRGRYLVDFSPNPTNKSKGEFFRVVFNSPTLTDSIVDDLIANIIDAGEMYKIR